MSKCCGNCDSCGGCAGQLVLSQPEINLLNKLAQIPFLPIARSAADPKPLYLEDGEETLEQYSLILTCLEKKGLISLDFDMPLAGYTNEKYPIWGSMALTKRGQDVLDVLDKQGAEE